MLVKVEAASQRSQSSMTDVIEVGPLQSWESRSGGGKKKCRTPKIRKKCLWKHAWKKMWVECPFMKKVGQVWTIGSGTWHKGVSVKGNVFLPPV